MNRFNKPLGKKSLIVLALLSFGIFFGCNAKLKSLESQINLIESNHTLQANQSFDDKVGDLKKSMKEKREKNEKEYSKSFYNAIIDIESAGNPNAVGSSGEVGLMQIMPAVLDDYNRINRTSYTKQDLFNPEKNKRVGKWYIKKMIRGYYSRDFNLDSNNLKEVMIAYNAGVGVALKVKKGKREIPKTTAKYLEKLAKRGITRLPIKEFS